MSQSELVALTISIARQMPIKDSGAVQISPIDGETPIAKTHQKLFIPTYICVTKETKQSAN